MKHAPPTQPTTEHSPIPRAALRVDEAARTLGLSQTGLHRPVREGRIRIVKIGCRTVIPMAAIDELLKEDTVVK